MPTYSATSAKPAQIQAFVHQHSATASAFVAREISDLILERAQEGRMAVLGLATGSTPLQLYRELIRMHQQEGLSFANVITFNLDEYCGLPADHPQSYHYFMWENLFRHVGIPQSQTFIPDGTASEDTLTTYCERWEQHITNTGGIDLQLLGIGRTGHIGFNEPGSTADSVTRQVVLAPLTRSDARSNFSAEKSVPTHAITMGVQTILQARRIRVLAWGEAKAQIVAEALTTAPSPQIPASFLQLHHNTVFHLDEAAAARLPAALRSPHC